MNEQAIKCFKLSVQLKEKCAPQLEALERLYGQDDFRTSLIGKPLNSIIIQILTFKANEITFYHHDWWDGLQVPIEGRKGLCERHDTFVKYMTFIGFFSDVESQLRVLVRKFRPGACSNGKAQYESIYKKILTDLGLNDDLNMFKFSGLIRNAIHNGGLYLPSSNTDDQKFSFNGTTYQFTYGEMIDFLYPELVVEIQDKTFDCIFKIVQHSEIQSIS